MTGAGQTARDGRAIAGLIAVFALMIQALIPAAAMAAMPPGAQAAIICTAAGTQAVDASGGAAPTHKGFGGLPCQDCLAAAMVAVVATPELGIQRVAYEAARVEHLPALSLIAPRARGPPRPPGQGPPTA